MELNIKNISTQIQKKTIIEDISMDVGSGQIIGILGANGSGKSTLLKTIYKTLKPVTGTIYLDSLNIETLSLNQLAQEMAVVSQFNATDFDFTVFDFVLMGRYPHKKNFEKMTLKDKHIVERSLDIVEMSGFKDRNVSTLSGGEKQRIVLARALAQQPECLILDEPANHLDIKYQLQLFSLLKGIQVTTVIAIHDIVFAYNFCDRVYALKEGRIVVSGIPEEAITEETIKLIYGVKANIIQCGPKNIAISYSD